MEAPRPSFEELSEEVQHKQDADDFVMRENSMEDWNKRAENYRPGLVERLTKADAPSPMDLAREEAAKIGSLAKELKQEELFDSTQEAADAAVRWREGAKKYKEFIDETRGKDKKYFSVMQQELMGVFLGEKPALFEPNEQHVNYSRAHDPKSASEFDQVCKALAKREIYQDGDYFYNPLQVQKAILKNFELFVQRDLLRPQEAIRYLAQTPNEEGHVIRGILIGFPASSARKFADGDRQGRDTNLRGDYGIRWNDPNPSPEVELQSRRIQAAYRKSGILEIK